MRVFYQTFSEIPQMRVLARDRPGGGAGQPRARTRIWGIFEICLEQISHNINIYANSGLSKKSSCTACSACLPQSTREAAAERAGRHPCHCTVVALQTSRLEYHIDIINNDTITNIINIDITNVNITIDTSINVTNININDIYIKDVNSNLARKRIQL